MNLSANLMPHQVEGIDFLVKRKAGLLAFEQGLGKTLVAIAAFDHLYREGSAEVMVVLCPNSIKRNWAAEIVRFAPHLESEIIEGPPKQRRAALTRSRAPVALIGYETARVEISGVLALLSRRRTVLVLDESHAVKNRHSLTSIAAQHFAPRCKYRWLLSGTPVPNTVADLHAQLAIVAGGVSPLGTFESFLAAHGDGRASALLRARLEPFLLRRTKAECLDLPRKDVVDLHVELPVWQRKLYDDMRDELVCEIESLTGVQFRAQAPTVLAKLLRLVQLASNPALVVPTEPRIPAKFMELDRLVEDIVVGMGEKIVIWTHYVKTLETLAHRFRAQQPLLLYGATPAADRQLVVAQFQTDPAARVLIANPAAGGTGFTLTAACYAVYETLSWRYDFYAQSQDRVHRIGQDRAVSCIRLLASDTIEQVIAAALERKAELARALLGDRGGVGAILALSPDEFCTMLLHNRLPENALSA